MKKMRKFAEGGIYTAEMGKPPTDPEGVSATKKPMPKPPVPKKTAPQKDTVFREGMPVPQDMDGASVRKMSKGGSASSRADGCATKGKTKGTMIAMCGGGMMKKK